MYSKLQYISQGNTSVEQLANISAILDAGCEWIQLRFKDVDERTFLNLAEQVKKNCEHYKVTLIVNDRVHAAKHIDADGVHVGLSDMSVSEARNVLGEDKIIGGTANTLVDVLKRADEQCNYIGLGPLRFTETKKNLSPILGIEGYEKMIYELEQRGIDIPVYAIGGIQLEDVKTLMDKGVYGIAVSGLLTKHPHKKEIIEQLNFRLYTHVTDRR